MQSRGGVQTLRVCLMAVLNPTNQAWPEPNMNKDDRISQRLITSRLFLPPPHLEERERGSAYVFRHNYIHGFLREAFFHLEMRLTRWPVVCRHDNVVLLCFCGVNWEQPFIHLLSQALIHLLGVCPGQGCWSGWDKLNKMAGCVCGQCLIN